MSDPEVLLYEGNLCSNCGNTEEFFFDREVCEVVCLKCGVVVSRLYWRKNYYAKEE